MKQKSIILFIFLFVFLSWNGFAQNLTNNSSTLSATLSDGSYHTISVGEMTLVNTEQNQNIIITQGFLQPDDRKTPAGSEDLIHINSLIQVYPNPTHDFIHLKTEQQGNIEWTLSTINGQIIQKKTVHLGDNESVEQIDLSTLSNGTYFLNISLNQKDNQAPLKGVYKILKIK